MYSKPLLSPNTGVPMSAVVQIEDLSPRLSPLEAAFIRTVLDHRGVGCGPSLAELSAAFDVLHRYNQQRDAHPAEDPWEPRLGGEAQVELRAKAFLMFGATRPTAAQWHKAHVALYGPLLCEACG